MDRILSPRRTRYEPHREVSLRLTLGPLSQGSTDPTIQRDASGFWLTMTTASGTASLHLTARAGGVDAAAWGDGAEHAIAGVPALLGADDDDTGFDPSRHPLVAELHRRTPGLRLTRAARILPFLIPTVLAQKVTAIEAKRAWRELVRRHGEPAPGPVPLGMRVAPSAAVWRRVPFTSSHIASACGSGTSSAVTIHGPTGPKVSQPLPLSQVPPRSSWYSRSETSLTTQ